MIRKIDYIFNSDKITSYKPYQLASGYISETSILFEKENIIVVIEAKGKIDYYDLNENLITSANAPQVNNGRELYEDIRCLVKSQMIILQFPHYKWIDNYPHCDGEHDRWDTVITGYYEIKFNLLDHTIS